MDEIYGMEEFRTSFKQVVDEIDDILQDSCREQETLARLRTLFSEEKIRRFEELIDITRKRARESEERALAALQEAERYKNDLARERTRIEKLWDAYKRQEDELRHHGMQREELEADLADREGQIRELKACINDMEELKEKQETLDMMRQELAEANRELEELRVTLVKERERNNTLQAEVDDLKSYVPYKRQAEELAARVKELEPLRDLVKIREQYRDMEDKYRKEQERLAKLFKKFEEVSHDCEEAQAKLDKWESWYAENRTFIESAAAAFSKFQMPE
jgi:chromosome segregation ATPase